MKTLTLLLFFTLICNRMLAQQLAKNQAIEFAEKLYKVEILSEKGRDALKERIEQDRLPAYGEVERKNEDFPFHLMDTDISVSSMLYFLVNAFGADFYFRSGMSMEINQAIEEKFYKEKSPENMTETEMEALEPQIQAFMLTFEGPRIEAAIPTEDSLMKGGISFFPGMVPQGAENGWIHPKRSVLGKTRIRTIKELLQIGLIDERIYNDVFLLVESGELFMETLVLFYLTKQANYYERFKENKTEELQFVQKLRDAKLMSDSNYQKLLASYKTFEIKNKFDYLPYCNNTLVFKTSGYSLDPKVYYVRIFADIKQLLPDFDYKNLSIEIKEDSNYSEDLIQQTGIISFEVNDTKYITSFFHNFIKKKHDKYDRPDTLPQISHEFHKGINKWLADRNAEFRLYYANNPADGAYANKTFGLLLMTETQFKTWETLGDYFIFQESHDNTFNTNNIQQFIQEYEQLGLFSHLTDAEIAEGKNRVLASEINGYQSILSCFPKTLVIFDWESGNLENPYEELTQEFAAISRGAFTPTDIVDNFAKDWEAEKEKTLYGFKIKGKTYQEELELRNDWLDPMFMELIENALEEHKVDGKIYYCMNDGQVGGYIFLTLSQYTYLKAKQPTLFEE